MIHSEFEENIFIAALGNALVYFRTGCHAKPRQIAHVRYI